MITRNARKVNVGPAATLGLARMNPMLDSYRQKGIFGKRPGEVPVVKEAPAAIQVTCEDPGKEERRKAEIAKLKKSIADEIGHNGEEMSLFWDKSIAASVLSTSAIGLGAWTAASSVTNKVPDIISAFSNNLPMVATFFGITAFASWAVHILLSTSIYESIWLDKQLETYNAQMRLLNYDENNVPPTLVKDIELASKDPRWVELIGGLMRMELGIE